MPEVNADINKGPTTKKVYRVSWIDFRRASPRRPAAINVQELCTLMMNQC